MGPPISKNLQEIDDSDPVPGREPKNKRKKNKNTKKETCHPALPMGSRQDPLFPFPRRCLEHSWPAAPVGT